jgi:hypothetical protein
MSHEISLTEEELGIVRRALERELESSRLEHRHTRNLSYREKVHHEIEDLERLLNVTFGGQHMATRS